MQKLYQELKGINGNGFLLSKHKTDAETLIRGVVLVLSGKQIFSVIHANDKGWHDKSGKVYNFHLSGNALFIRNIVFKFNAMPSKEDLQRMLVNLRIKKT